MALRWGERRRVERLVARTRTLVAEADAVRNGQPQRRPLESLADDLVAVLGEALPLLSRSPLVPLLVIDAARVSLWLEVSSRSWARVLGVGVCLASAVTVVRQHATDDLDVALERELGRHVGAHLDAVFYGAAKAGLPSFVGTLSDMVLGPGYLSRQLVQTSDDSVLEAWDWGTGLALNGGLEAGQEERALRVSQGDGWLSDRQRTVRPPEELVAVMTDWATWGLSTLESLPLRTTTRLTASSDPAEAEWAQVLKSVDHVLAHPSAERLVRAAGLLCVTPLAAQASGRDIIFLVGSPFGGLAVRFFGGSRYRSKPEVSELPDADLRSLRQMRASIHKANSGHPVDAQKRATDLDAVRREVGDRIISPMLETWTDLTRIALIPVGEMQDLPLSSALVRGSLWTDGRDMTIAPTASSILVAATPRGPNAADRAVVMGDPASGAHHLPWIATEVRGVAAVYERTPDLIVEYPPEPVTQNSKVREVRLIDPIPGGTSEHVLSRLERARIVHLACHGAVPDATGLPELFLSGRIPFDALQHHRFAREACVVLSACSVARSVNEAPLAVLGFPAMLLAAGAATVIASSWPLPDCEETVDFMVELHRNLASGMTSATALVAASTRMRSEGIPSSIWAGFDVYGA